jgi:hypothetical protein
MDILRNNTPAIFQIVPRKTLDQNLNYTIKIKNETAQKTQIISLIVALLPNENYQVTLASFPNGKIGEKLSYEIIESESKEVICLGKMFIVSKNESVQDYTRQNNNKFYK